MIFVTGIPAILLFFSYGNCFSSKRRMNNKYVNCSITVKGFEIPPVQKNFHIQILTGDTEIVQADNEKL